MALKWVATNNGGFWEDDGKGAASSPSTTPTVQTNFAAQQNPVPAPTNVNSSPAVMAGTNSVWNQSFEQNEAEKARQAAIRGEVYIPVSQRNYTTDGRYDNVTAIQQASEQYKLPWENVSMGMASGDIKTADDVRISADFLQPGRGGMNPDVRKQIEALSSQTGRPFLEVARSMATSDPAIAAEVSKINDEWKNRYGESYTVAPNQNPFDADQKSWLYQNSGIVSGIIAGLTGIGAPLMGTLAGFGTSATIGGLPLATKNLPWALGGAYGADALANAGAFGGNIQDYAGSRVTPMNYNNKGSIPSGTTTGSTATSTSNIPTSPNGTPGAINNIPSTKLRDYSVSGNNPFTSTGPSALTGKQITNAADAQKAITEVAKETAKATGNNSVLDLVKQGSWMEALKTIASTPAGAASLGGLIGQVFNNGDAPEQQAVDTGGLNLTQSYLERLKPEYYKMSDAEKDNIYNRAMEKISANLAERGVTRGAVAVEATKDLIEQIELQDLQQQRQYASNAFYSFVNFISGKESQAYTDYINATNMFNSERSAFNNNIANLIESTLGKKTTSTSYRTLVDPATGTVTVVNA